MRTEEEMFSVILETVKADERIRAVYMNGSRVNPEAKRDMFHETAKSVADSLGFWYNEEEAEASLAFFRRVRRLPEDAVEI